MTERSRVCRLGPRNVPRPRFPHVLAVGNENASGLNHCFCVFRSTGPVNDGLMSGRSGFRVFPSPDRFDPAKGVNGKPLNMDVKDASGKTANWEVELGAPAILMRNGWTRNALKVGESVTVKGSLAKDGSNLLNATTVTLSDGKRVFAGSSGGDGQTQ